MRLLVYASDNLAGWLEMADGEPFYGFTYENGLVRRDWAACDGVYRELFDTQFSQAIARGASRSTT